MAKKITLEQFLKRATSKHGNKFDYSKAKYVNMGTKITIICPIHKEFTQTPSKHIKSKHGCRKCSDLSRTKPLDQFIAQSREIHGDKYDYSQSVYTTATSYIDIICKEHGVFSQIANSHLVGHGCIRCARVCKLTTKEWIEKATKKHGNLYDYSLVKYIDSDTKVTIKCNKCNNIWKQVAFDHTSGHGCPSCQLKTQSKVYKILQDILPNHEIIMDTQWEPLDKRRPDFRIDSLKLIIEYDGEQHFEQVSNWDPPELTCLKDTHKSILCLKEGYTVIRLSCLFINEDNWIDILKPHLCLHDNPTIIFLDLEDNYYNHEEYYHIYKDDIDQLVLDIESTELEINK